MAKIKLVRLHCNLNDEVDKDELYIKFNGKRIWPDMGIYKSVDSGEKVDIGTEIEQELPLELKLELWDFDYLSKNDLLGTFNMKIKTDDFDDTYFTNMKLERTDSTASYMLEWRLLK